MTHHTNPEIVAQAAKLVAPLLSWVADARSTACWSITQQWLAGNASSAQVESARKSAAAACDEAYEALYYRKHEHTTPAVAQQRAQALTAASAIEATARLAAGVTYGDRWDAMAKTWFTNTLAEVESQVLCVID